MVVLIREVVNKNISYTSATISNSTMTSIPSNMDMNDIRRQSALFSLANSRSLSVFLKASSIAYPQHMTLNNNLSDYKIHKSINSSHLSYVDYTKEGESVSLATDSTSGKECQHICNENPALKRAPKLYGKNKKKTVGGTNFEPSENMFNIQLLYDIN